jgi:ABC-type proline/glycine betaine transport system permease subunit
MKLHIMQSSPGACYLVPLCSLLQVPVTSFHYAIFSRCLLPCSIMQSSPGACYLLPLCNLLQAPVTSFHYAIFSRRLLPPSIMQSSPGACYLVPLSAAAPFSASYGILSAIRMFRIMLPTSREQLNE